MLLLTARALSAKRPLRLWKQHPGHNRERITPWLGDAAVWQTGRSPAPIGWGDQAALVSWYDDEWQI
jgi:hypothetical protein